MPDDVSQIIDEMLSSWARQGVRLHGPASPEQLHAFSNRLGIELDDAFERLYMRANGMHFMDADKRLFCLWPLEMILERGLASAANTSENFLAHFTFADGFLAAHFFALRYWTRERYDVRLEWGEAATNGSNIADSFVEFLRLYQSQDDSLLLPSP